MFRSVREITVSAALLFQLAACTSSPRYCGATADCGPCETCLSGTCVAAPLLSPQEASIARAYLGLLGRVPELNGLNYWLQDLGSHLTVSEVSDAILGSLAELHLPPATYDDQRYVETLFVNLLGKNADDDPAGVAYWVSQLTTLTPGQIVELIPNAAVDEATLLNRLTVLDCSVRLAKLHRVSLRISDTLTVIQRVTADPAAPAEALSSYHALLRPDAPPRPLTTLDSSYTPGTLFAASEQKTFDGASSRHYRRMVWWNRDGDPLWAYVVMPTSYLARTDWPAIVMAHGGGWREGAPDDLQIYATRLAAKGYVVFLTAYRLTIGDASPAQQNDLADFVGIVKASAGAFGINPAEVGLFGLSAGGHLMALLGATGNYGCVAALFPPLDLADPDLIPGAPWYVESYLAGTPAAEVSPTSAYAASTSTQFLIQHSIADGVVPHAQSVAFLNKIGAAKATLLTFDSCPDSSSSPTCDFHGIKGYQGADRDTSINDLHLFYRNTCGYH